MAYGLPGELGLEDCYREKNPANRDSREDPSQRVQTGDIQGLKGDRYTRSDFVR
jgi:hypothetical protein